MCSMLTESVNKFYYMDKWKRQSKATFPWRFQAVEKHSERLKRAIFGYLQDQTFLLWHQTLNCEGFYACLYF